MKPRTRVLCGLASPVCLVLLLWIAWVLLPSPRQCLAIFCGSQFKSGGVNVFGEGTFTLPQTLVMAVGIVIAAYLLASGTIPGRRWAAVGFAALTLCLSVAWLLPSPTVGPAPTVPCSTPGADGTPIPGRCGTARAPVDHRLDLRIPLAGLGLAVLTLGVAADNSKKNKGTTTVHLTAT